MVKNYLVAEEGFEPPTQGLWFLCSNQLSYSALFCNLSAFILTSLTFYANSNRLNEKIKSKDFIEGIKAYIRIIETGSSK